MFRRRRNTSPLKVYDKAKAEEDEDSSPSKKIRNPVKHLKASRVSPLLPNNVFSNYLLAAAVIVYTIRFAAQQIPPMVMRQSISHILRPTEHDLKHLRIVLRHPLGRIVRPFYLLRTLGDEEERSPSFGGIEFYSLEDEPIFSRRIDPDDEDAAEEGHSELLEEIDDHHFPHIYEPDEDLEDWGSPCKRPSWKEQRFPTCNNVHEHVLERPTSKIQGYDIKYLGYVSLQPVCFSELYSSCISLRH